MGKASDDGASLRAVVTRILRPAVLRGEELHRAISAILSTYASPQATENAEHKLHDVVIEIPNQLPQRKFAIYFTYNQCPSKCQLMKIRFIGFLLLMSSAASAYGVQLIGRILTPGLERVWKHKVRNKIWIADQLAIRGSPHSPMCKTCNPMPKSAAHLSCAFASEIWQLLSLVTPSIAAADLTENSVML